MKPRVIAYRPELTHSTRSVNAGILMSQIMHWHETLGHKHDGWFWMTMEDITEQTGLSIRQQRQARALLVQQKLLEVKRRGAPPRLYYRLNRDNLYIETREETMKRLKRNEAASKTAKADKPRQIPQEPGDTGEGQRVAGSTVARASCDEAAPEIVGESLVARLTAEGIAEAVARKLVQEKPDECNRQLEHLPFVKNIRQTRSGFLRRAIEVGFEPPRAFLKAQEARKRQQQLIDMQEATAVEMQRQKDKRESLLRQMEELRELNPESYQEFMADFEHTKEHTLNAAINSSMYRVLKKVWSEEERLVTMFDQWLNRR